MTKRYCDRCGKELCIEDSLKPLVWWTITRHSSFSGDISAEICDDCYIADRAEQTEPKEKNKDCTICEHREHCHYLPKDIPWDDCGWKEPKGELK